MWLRVKNPPAKQKMQVWSLGWEDPLDKEMAAHSSILVFFSGKSRKGLDGEAYQAIVHGAAKESDMT